MLKCAIICLLYIVAQGLGVSYQSDISSQEYCDNHTECSVGFDTQQEEISEHEVDLDIWGHIRLLHLRRIISQTNRIHKANFTRSVAAMASCGKVVNPSSITFYHLLLDRFPSGLKENRNKFISLGKLVI